jgi:hypothetical protein
MGDSSLVEEEMHALYLLVRFQLVVGLSKITLCNVILCMMSTYERRGR